jgi:predicted O-methyltransferase YrrM
VASVNGPSIAVELGAWKGRSTCFMGVEIANSGKPIRFFTVDHWLGSADEESNNRDPDVQAGRLFEVFQRNIIPVAAQVEVIRSDTAAAAERFADGSVDFLYVDASHSYEGVLRDLIAWFPKVSDGGLVAGDDWCFSARGEPSVRNAVVDFFGKNASGLRIDPGSEPNPDYLQWSIVKARDLRHSSSGRLIVRRAMRAIARTLPSRAIRAALRRLR